MDKYNSKRNFFIILGIVLLVAVSFIIIANTITGKAISTSYQCSDNKDNDLDKKCDFAGCTIKRVKYPADPDCTSAQDNSERCEPVAEICDNKDNDCDGSIDENLVSQCGITDVGECNYGTKSCSAGIWGNCVGNVDPLQETCDGLDNDCNGLTDEGCNCINGRTQSCGSDVGECIVGSQTCINGDWGACQGEVLPSTEICDGLDNDCDSSTDEGCNCINGETKSCGSDVGDCIAGSQTCINGDWANCVGSTGPSTEICDGLDNDCDSSTDEGNVCNPDSCTDSDGGFFTRIKGNVTGFNNNWYYSYVDFCTSNMTITEYYCSGTKPMNVSASCNVNTTTRCSNGACI